MASHPKLSDAFGQALWDQHHGLGMPAVIERDDGRIEADMYGMRLYFAAYAEWPAIEKKALRQARGRVLDIGCGAGRHALHLQAKGHRVTAIDNSPLAVALCRERGVKDARVLPVAEVGKLAPAQFDTVILLGHNLALLGSARGARSVLRQLHRITTNGARVIGTTIDPYMTRDREHLAYQRRNRRRGRMSGQLRFRVRYGSLATPWLDFLLISKRELEQLLEGTGWTLKAHIPSGGPPYAVVLEKSVGYQAHTSGRSGRKSA